MKNDMSGLHVAHEVVLTMSKEGASRKNFWVPLQGRKELARKVFQTVILDYTTMVVRSFTSDYSPNAHWAAIKKAGLDDKPAIEQSLRYSLGLLWPNVGEVEQTMAAFRFDCKFSHYEDIIATMRALGFEPATPIDVLMFFGNYQLQNKNQRLISLYEKGSDNPEFPTIYHFEDDDRVIFYTEKINFKDIENNWFVGVLEKPKTLEDILPKK